MLKEQLEKMADDFLNTFVKNGDNAQKEIRNFINLLLPEIEANLTKSLQGDDVAGHNVELLASTIAVKIAQTTLTLIEAERKALTFAIVTFVRGVLTGILSAGI